MKRQFVHESVTLTAAIPDERQRLATEDVISVNVHDQALHRLYHTHLKATANWMDGGGGVEDIHDVSSYHPVVNRYPYTQHQADDPLMSSHSDSPKN